MAKLLGLMELLKDPTYGTIANIGFYIISFMAIAAAMVHLSSGLAGRNWDPKKKQGIMKAALLFGLLLGLAMAGIAEYSYETFFAQILQWVMLISIPFVLFFLKSLFFVATKLVTHEGNPLWAWLLAFMGTSTWILVSPIQIQHFLKDINLGALDGLFLIVFAFTILGGLVILFGNLLGIEGIAKHFRGPSPAAPGVAPPPSGQPPSQPAPAAQGAAPAVSAIAEEASDISKEAKIASGAALKADALGGAS